MQIMYLELSLSLSVRNESNEIPPIPISSPTTPLIDCANTNVTDVGRSTRRYRKLPDGNRAEPSPDDRADIDRLGPLPSRTVAAER